MTIFLAPDSIFSVDKDFRYYFEQEFGPGFKVFHLFHKGEDYFLLQGKHKSRFVEAYGNERKAFMKRYCKKHFGQHDPIELPDDSLFIFLQQEKEKLTDICVALALLGGKIRDKDWTALEEARQDRVLFDIIRYIEVFAKISQADISHSHAKTVSRVVDDIDTIMDKNIYGPK